MLIGYLRDYSCPTFVWNDSVLQTIEQVHICDSVNSVSSEKSVSSVGSVRSESSVSVAVALQISNPLPQFPPECRNIGVWPPHNEYAPCAMTDRINPIPHIQTKPKYYCIEHVRLNYTGHLVEICACRLSFNVDTLQWKNVGGKVIPENTMSTHRMKLDFCNSTPEFIASSELVLMKITATISAEVGIDTLHGTRCAITKHEQSIRALSIIYLNTFEINMNKCEIVCYALNFLLIWCAHTSLITSRSTIVIA